MKFTAAGIAVSIATVTALAPGASFVRCNTALEGHALSGYDPSEKQAVPYVGPSGIPGFSGFSHAIGSSTIAPVSVAPAPCVAPTTDGVVSFSGFNHATAQMREKPSLIGQTFVSPAPAVAPTNNAPQDLVFSSFLGRVVAARKAPSAPVFSGFGHFKGKMGGNPPLVGKSSNIAKAPPATGFSGFGHSPGQMGGNSSMTTKR